MKNSNYDAEAPVTTTPDENNHQMTLFIQNAIVSYKYQG